MKKVAILLFAVVTFVLLATPAEAAYVHIPSFYDITSNKIEKRIDFLGMEEKSYKGVYYAHWKYEVCNGKTREYVNKYINKIDSRHDFRLIGRDGNHWYFIYTGNQTVKPINGNFHIHVGVNGRNVVVDCAGGIHPSVNTW